jgi:hypothetical protein
VQIRCAELDYKNSFSCVCLLKRKFVQSWITTEYFIIVRMSAFAMGLVGFLTHRVFFSRDSFGDLFHFFPSISNLSRVFSSKLIFINKVVISIHLYLSHPSTSLSIPLSDVLCQKKLTKNKE